MGVFEWPDYAAGTLAVARAVADCEGHTVVGGAIQSLHSIKADWLHPLTMCLQAGERALSC